MKKRVLFFVVLLLALISVHARTTGRLSVSFNGVTVLSSSEASPVFVYNAGTSTVYVAFGGHSAAATNDPATYHANRMPLRAGFSYTTRGKFSFVSVYSVTNGLIDIGFEGGE